MKLLTRIHHHIARLGQSKLVASPKSQKERVRDICQLRQAQQYPRYGNPPPGSHCPHIGRVHRPGEDADFALLVQVKRGGRVLIIYVPS